MNTQDQNITGKPGMPMHLQATSEGAISVANDRRQIRTVISNTVDSSIEILHRDDDPSTWIVRRWKKILWFKKRISTDWFIDRQQAFAYANTMKEKHHHAQ